VKPLHQVRAETARRSLLSLRSVIARSERRRKGSCHVALGVGSAERHVWPDHVAVPTFGPCMVCTSCGIVGADARPTWQEQPPRETLTG
jgi:hypothetical protein